jgi:glutamate--cysteine ligase
MIETVPYLETPSVRAHIDQLLSNQRGKIESWFSEQWLKNSLPVYCSIDCRHASFKLAPIDTNLFPAGFNNLSQTMLPIATLAAKTYFDTYAANQKKLLIIAENHTRNSFYLENLASLQQILASSGLTVHIGSVLSDLQKTLTVTLPSKREIHLEPIKKQEQRIVVNDFIPDIILLNNDLTDGIPEQLNNIIQPILPPTALGWIQRLKSQHFEYYRIIANTFAQRLGIDPWFITPDFSQCNTVNFMEREGEECLSQKVDELLKKIQKKYDEYGINETPFVIIKANAGSYGMGVITVTDPAHIKQLNRKQRQQMATSKGKRAIDKVIIQEGVYSMERWGEEKLVAEPVIYFFGQHSIGGFYRMHEKRGPTENLNSPGMQFQALNFDYIDNNLHLSHLQCDRSYAYSVVARLAVLAAAQELEDIQQ